MHNDIYRLRLGLALDTPDPAQQQPAAPCEGMVEEDRLGISKRFKTINGRGYAGRLGYPSLLC